MKYYDSGSLQTDDGAAIISQVHSTGFACVCLCVCVCFLIRCEQKAGRVARCRTFGERTVGDGDVQLALPGHLPRFVDGVLRCRNTTTGVLFTARSHADTHSLQLQMKDNSGGGNLPPCHAALLLHWLPTKCGSVTLSLQKKVLI